MNKSNISKELKIQKAKSLGIDMDFDNTKVTVINKMIKLAEE